MSIRDSRKFRNVLLAAGSVLAIYALLNTGLLALARNAERNAAAYPWRGEGHLRYMLPTLFEKPQQDWSFIAGPSEAREDLLYERFEAAFPDRTAYQGGMSLGTIDDLLLVLDYLENAYGEEAIPRSLIVGITPRFVSNIRGGVASPLARSVTRYSPVYKVAATADGPRLIEKSALESWLSRVRFWSKVQGRYHAAVCAIALEKLERRQPQAANPWLASREQATEPMPVRSVEQVLRLCRSPYKYHHRSPMSDQVIREWSSDTTSFWYGTHQWDPSSDSTVVHARLTRLLQLCERLGIRVYVINLPEHPIIRAGYQPGRYQAYLRIVRSAIGETPFLDLRELLPAEQFYDAGHATLRGAITVTDTTIHFMRAHQTPELFHKASRSD